MSATEKARRRLVDPWNLLLAALTLAVFAYGAAEVPNFLSAFNLSQLAAGMAEKALLVRVDPLWLQGIYGLVILAAIGIDASVSRSAEAQRLSARRRA